MFWKVWKENIKRQYPKILMYGKLKSRFGSKYLRENQYLLDRD